LKTTVLDDHGSCAVSAGPQSVLYYYRDIAQICKNYTPYAYGMTLIWVSYDRYWCAGVAD